jgi:hypothetical protein
MFVPAGSTVRAQRRFGPAFGRFSRNHGTQLVAAVVLGAIVGGGTVAIVETANMHDQRGPQVSRSERPVSPFGGNGFGRRGSGQGGFGGAQGSQGGQGSGG